MTSWTLIDARPQCECVCECVCAQPCLWGGDVSSFMGQGLRRDMSHGFTGSGREAVRAAGCLGAAHRWILSSLTSNSEAFSPHPLASVPLGLGGGCDANSSRRSLHRPGSWRSAQQPRHHMSPLPPRHRHRPTRQALTSVLPLLGPENSETC